MSHGKKYYTSYIGIRGSSWGAPLLRLERAAFGWHYQGNVYHDDFDGFDSNLNVKHKIYKNYYFCRHKPYSANPLFVISEMLMKIVSFIRRIIMPILPIVIVVGVILAIFVGEALKMFAIVAGSIYGGVIGATLLFAFLGWLWRTAFRIDKKVAEDMEANGYDPTTFNFDENDMD